MFGKALSLFLADKFMFTRHFVEDILCRGECFFQLTPVRFAKQQIDFELFLTSIQTDSSP